VTTRQAFREKIEYQLADTNNKIWSDADLNAYIQEAYSLFIAQTGLLWGQSYLNDRADTAVVDLPADFFKVDRVLWNYREIPELTPQELRFRDARYMTQTSGTIYGYLVQQEAKDQLRKYPVPSTDCPTDGVDTRNTRLDYFKRAPSLASDASVFTCPDWCLKHIRNWVMYKAYSQKSLGQDLKLAGHFRDRFSRAVARTVRRLGLVDNERVGVLGGAGEKPRAIPTPRLPWEFGKIVRRF
jgi:hypothetical protein